VNNDVFHLEAWWTCMNLRGWSGSGPKAFRAVASRPLPKATGTPCPRAACCASGRPRGLFNLPQVSDLLRSVSARMLFYRSRPLDASHG
jgi:hypothetical protein